MSRLNTKLLRELSCQRWQFIAVAVTIILGIGFFLGSLVSYGNLGKSYDLTYRRLAFGDVWVRMASAPDALLHRVQRLSGVDKVIGRNVFEVRVALKDRRVNQVMGRIISLPADKEPAINRVRVVSGRYFSPQGGREALLEVSFANAHNYQVGEFIYPTIAGEEIRFRIVGLVQSAEYIYSVQSEQYLIPTPDTFGVIFIPDHQADTLFATGGSINEICLTTDDPYRRTQIAQALERLTDRYGGEEPITREEQPSNKLLMMDLEGYRQMAVIFPLLFLTAGVLTTYSLLARIVQAQRPQIGVLRATGFSQQAILRHYLWIALIPALAGGTLGIIFGYGFAWLVIQIYIEMLNIPYIFFEPRFAVVVAAVFISAAAGLLGALSPARSAARLPPAVAMSQEAMLVTSLPKIVRALGRGFSPRLKFPLRNVVRKPLRTLYTVLGISLGVALIMLSFGLLDSVDYAMTTFFEDIELYDIAAGFDSEQPGRMISHIGSWPGVWRAEPTLDIAVDLSRGTITHATMLSGLPPDGRLRRLTTADGHHARPASGEVLLGAMLRNKLGVAEGDLLTIDYAQNRRDFKITRRVRVGPAITQPIGSTAYMRMEDVQRLFANRLDMPLQAANGVLIKADPARHDAIRKRLDRLSAVAAVQTRAQTYLQVQELMRFTKVFTGILAFFGIGLAFAVVFTAVSITVLERTRELATLRTLGFGFGSIVWFTSIENLLVAAAAALVGVPLGRWLDILLIASAQSESMSLEPAIYLRTYLFAILGVFSLTLVSQIPSLARLRRLNLAAATKQLTD